MESVSGSFPQSLELLLDPLIVVGWSLGAGLPAPLVLEESRSLELLLDPLTVVGWSLGAGLPAPPLVGGEISLELLLEDLKVVPGESDY